MRCCRSARGEPPNGTALFRFYGASGRHCTVPGGPSLFPPSTLPDFPPLTRGRSSPGGVQEGRRPLRSAPARCGSVIRFLGVWCVVGRARVLTARKAQCHPESPWRDWKDAPKEISAHFASEQRSGCRRLFKRRVDCRCASNQHPFCQGRGLCSRFGYRHSHAVCRWLHQPISDGMNARLELSGF